MNTPLIAVRIRVAPFSGTAGVEARRIGQSTDAFKPGLEHYAGLMRNTPPVIAGILRRDYNRGRNDLTVLAVRQ